MFDVDGFLEWLGIAAMVGHADTYGFAYHNFYLYDNPATGKLTWYSWDHNLTFRNDMRALLTFDKANVSDAWPLIRYLLDDPVYRERYAKLHRGELCRRGGAGGGDRQDTRRTPSWSRPMRRWT